MVYGRYNKLVSGVYKATFLTGYYMGTMTYCGWLRKWRFDTKQFDNLRSLTYQRNIRI